MGRKNRNKHILAQKVANQFSNKTLEDGSESEEEVAEITIVNKMASLQMFSSSEEEEEEDKEEEVEEEEEEEEVTGIDKAITSQVAEKVLINESKSTKKRNKNKNKKNKSAIKVNSTSSSQSNESASVNDEQQPYPPIINNAGDKPIVGRLIEIVGTKKAHLNGKRGKVIDFNPSSGRYNVELRGTVLMPTSTVIALKRENIVEASIIDRLVLIH